MRTLIILWDEIAQGDAMKRIIDGKRYDTEKAALIGNFDNIGRGVDSQSDFRYFYAGLYVTDSKHYFLAGHGGAMSDFRKAAGQRSWSSGEGIIPMGQEEALEWAERHLDPETIEEHFGDLVKDA